MITCRRQSFMPRIEKSDLNRATLRRALLTANHCYIVKKLNFYYFMIEPYNPKI